MQRINKLLLKQISLKVKKFKLYDQYKKEIEFILSPKEIIKEKELNNYNIIKGWNL